VCVQKRDLNQILGVRPRPAQMQPEGEYGPGMLLVERGQLTAGIDVNSPSPHLLPYHQVTTHGETLRAHMPSTKTATEHSPARVIHVGVSALRHWGIRWARAGLPSLGGWCAGEGGTQKPQKVPSSLIVL